MKVKFTKAFILTCTTLCMMLTTTATPAAGTGNDDPKEKKEEKKAKVSSSRNNSSVKIFTNIFRRVMHVIAKESDEQIDFYVFDLEGTMVKHYKMKTGDHQKIDNLARGNYIFSVFAGD